MRDATWLAGADDDEAVETFDQMGRSARTGVLGRCRVGIAFDQQHDPAQGRFALPETKKRIQFRGGSGDQIGGQRDRPQSYLGGGSGGDGSAFQSDRRRITAPSAGLSRPRGADQAATMPRTNAACEGARSSIVAGAIGSTIAANRSSSCGMPAR